MTTSSTEGTLTVDRGTDVPLWMDKYVSVSTQTDIASDTKGSSEKHENNNGKIYL